MGTGLLPARATPRSGRRDGRRSGQEKSHHADDEDDGSRAVLHQHDEALIGLLMRFVVVAVGGGVGHFAMVCHLKSPLKSLILRANTAIGPTGQRRAAGMPRPPQIIPKASYPGSS